MLKNISNDVLKAHHVICNENSSESSDEMDGCNMNLIPTSTFLKVCQAVPYQTAADQRLSK